MSKIQTIQIATLNHLTRRNNPARRQEAEELSKDHYLIFDKAIFSYDSLLDTYLLLFAAKFQSVINRHQ